MRVCLVVFGWVEMHDAVDPVDMNAASGDIGSDQRLGLAINECPERVVALVLGAATMYHARFDAVLLELASHAIRPVSSATKHDCLSVCTDLVGCERNLFGSVKTHEPVGHAGHIRFPIANLVRHWIVLIAICEDLHFLAERRGEKDGLAILVCRIKDLLHYGKESHVGHTVRFVDNGDLYFAEPHFVLVDEVKESAGARHQHVHAITKCFALRPETYAAVYGGHRAAANVGQRLEFLSDLLGEFSGGRQDQPGWCVRSRIAQASDHGNAESQGLSRTSRRSPKDVTPVERIGDRCRLNLERCGDAVRLQGFVDVARDAKIGKRKSMAIAGIGLHGELQMRGVAHVR